MIPDEAFRYESLISRESRIRLITLLPGRLSSQITCLIRTVPLLRRRGGCKYDALSYVWGPPDDLAHYIILQGKRFPVRKNLWSALSHLRHPSLAQDLWIDAICINQNDISERNKQVRMMKHIYGQAACVRIWLGPLTTGLDHALDIIEEFGRPCKPQRALLIKFAIQHVYWFQFIGQEFLECEYWNRVWIIQEVLMATNPRIHCGGRVLKWATFDRAVEVMEDVFQSLPYLFRIHNTAVLLKGVVGDLLRTNAVQMLKRHIANKTSNFKLMVIAQNSSCTDLHDKLYGILGLAEELSIKVDYRKSIFGMYCDMMPLAPEIFPNELQGFYLVQFSQCLQSLLKGPHHRMSTTIGCISIKGFFTSTIHQLSGLEFDKSSRWPLNSNHVSRKLRKEDRKNMFSFIRNDRFWQENRRRRLRHCLEGIDNSTVQKVQPLQHYHFTLQTKPFDHQTSFQPKSKPYDTTLKSPQIQVKRTWQTQPPTSPPPSAQFFLGERGEVGLAPAQAELGDIICRFLRSDIVAILRSTIDENKEVNYELVGRGLIIKSPNYKKNSRPNPHPSGAGFGRGPTDLPGECLQFQHIKDLKEYVKIEIDFETLQGLTC